VSVAVQIGDHVQKGQLLASLDDRVLRSACDAQKARIASAKAQETEWESEEQTARADLRRAEQNAPEQNHQPGNLGTREVQSG